MAVQTRVTMNTPAAPVCPRVKESTGSICFGLTLLYPAAHHEHAIPGPGGWATARQGPRARIRKAYGQFIIRVTLESCTSTPPRACTHRTACIRLADLLLRPRTLHAASPARVGQLRRRSPSEQDTTGGDGGADTLCSVQTGGRGKGREEVALRIGSSVYSARKGNLLALELGTLPLVPDPAKAKRHL
jgi:hypothetical protein